MSPRPQIDHIRRPQILEAASRVIAERGVAATRIADIAERAGTSPPALLYWFDSKDELLAEALSWADDAFYSRMAAAVEGIERPSERLRVLIEASIADYDWTLWMELWTRALRDEDAARMRRRQDRRWRQAIERELEAAQEAGELDESLEPERLAVILASLLDGLAVQATLEDPAVDRYRLRELALQTAEQLLGAELPGAAESEGWNDDSGRRSKLLAGGEKR